MAEGRWNTITRRVALLEVLEQVMVLLREHGHDDEAVWLGSRAEVIRSPASSDEEIRNAMNELHSIVPRMGGLLDLPLDVGPHGDAATARDSLDELADRLYELTR